MNEKIIGQWTGISGDGAYVLANIDQENNRFSGHVAMLEIISGTGDGYWSWARVEGIFTGRYQIEGRVYPPDIYHRSGVILTTDELNDLYERTNVQHPTTTTFTGEIDNNQVINIQWDAKYPSAEARSDSVIISKASDDTLSSVQSTTMSWADFKSHILQDQGQFIYRGQENHWRLRTSFHRTGYANIVTYLDRKIPFLEQQINHFSGGCKNNCVTALIREEGEEQWSNPN